MLVQNTCVCPCANCNDPLLWFNHLTDGCHGKPSENVLLCFLFFLGRSIFFLDEMWHFCMHWVCFKFWLWGLLLFWGILLILSFTWGSCSCSLPVGVCYWSFGTKYSMLCCQWKVETNLEKSYSLLCVDSLVEEGWGGRVQWPSLYSTKITQRADGSLE